MNLLIKKQKLNLGILFQWLFTTEQVNPNLSDIKQPFSFCSGVQTDSTMSGDSYEIFLSPLDGFEKVTTYPQPRGAEYLQ